MKNFLFSVLTISIVFFSSCTKDACKDVACSNGICTDGTCNCSSGYIKGTDGKCVAERDVFTGSWKGTGTIYSSLNGGSITDTARTISIVSSATAGNKVLIGNLVFCVYYVYQPTVAVTATVSGSTISAIDPISGCNGNTITFKDVVWTVNGTTMTLSFTATDTQSDMSYSNCAYTYNFKKI